MGPQFSKGEPLNSNSTDPLAEIERRALDPALWLEHGESLLAAAKVLYDRLVELFHQAAVDEHQRIAELGMHCSCMLLIGAALEAALKALAAQRGLIQIRDGKIAFNRGVQGATSHKLIQMAESLDVRLGPERIDLFRRAEYFLAAEGRYPTARRIGDSVKANADGTRKLTDRDLSLAGALLAEARAQVV